MNRSIALIAISTLVACELPDNTKDDSYTTPYTTPKTDAISIESGSVDCLDESTVEFQMSTTGPVVSAEIYSQETANAEPQWAENTNLVSVGNGMWEQTMTTLPYGSTPSEVIQDQTSLFRCDRNKDGLGYHHNDQVMTYIFRAYDENDVEFDCVVAGEDPQGLIDFSYTVVSGRGPTNPGDINATNCHIEAFKY